jgi:hypothetical protein
LTTTVGYDPDTGYLPFDSADWVIATLGGYMGQGKDMSNNSVNSLLEGLKEHLPQRGDRLDGARGKDAVLLETLIDNYQKRNPGTQEQKKIDDQLKDIKAKRKEMENMSPQMLNRT